MRPPRERAITDAPRPATEALIADGVYRAAVRNRVLAAIRTGRAKLARETRSAERRRLAEMLVFLELEERRLLRPFADCP